MAALLLQLLQAHGVATGGLVVRSALPLVGDSAVVVVAKLQDMVEAASGGLLLQDAGVLPSYHPLGCCCCRTQARSPPTRPP